MTRMLLKYLLPLAMALPPAAQAIEMNWTGFGTAGYAISDQSYNYQRFINNQGTLKRDSILGAQVDFKFNQQWGATVQAKLAPSAESDKQWEAMLSWAFVSWRPMDDLLIRVGKFRLPLMLNTENADVGTTFDFVRLPAEVYSITPTTDVLGLSVSKSWLTDLMEWNLEAYTGKTETHWRYYGRELSEGRTGPGSWFVPIEVKSSGLVLTARDFQNTFRIGLHEIEVARTGAQTHVDIPFHPIAPGIGFYDLNASQRVKTLTVPVQTFGASIGLPNDFKLSGEYARMKFNGASEGLNRWGAYLAVSKRIANWTPYGYYARLKSTDSALGKYKTINGNTVPPLPPPYDADLINQSQKLAADILLPYDQWTGAIGTAYRITANGLIKAEWSHTRTGAASSLVDAPSGGDSADKRINVYSLSYSFTF